MNKKILFPISALILSIFLAYNLVEGKVGIIVNRHLYPSIQTSVDMYINDLKNIEGKDAWCNGTTFDETSNKADLKDSLRNHYDTDNLEGAIFIGDLPLSDFLSENEFERDIFPCDLYYMDLNGTWTPEDLPDTHSGSKGAEIWISRLVCSVLTHLADKTEEEILKRYFDRVHLRMYGQDNHPSTYLIAGMYGEWPSLESENKSYLGYNSSNIETFRTYSDSTDSVFTERWSKTLIAGKEYAYIYSHAGGLPYRHKVGYYIYDIYEDPTNCRFYNVYCCQNARYTTKNMCGAYATDDNGLVSIGAAKSGSMRPGSYRAYNEPLGNGKCFGEAFRSWYNSEGISSISWHYGMTLQGVGTLRVQPYNPPADNTAPNALTLTGQSIDENAGINIFVGTLSTTDPDAGQSHTYRLIYGDGDTDNDSFTITGDTLLAKVSFDYEQQNSFSIRIRTIDNGTGTLWYEKTFTITVNDINEAPTAIALSSQSIDENAGINTIIGTLSSTDPEINQTHTYTLVNGTGDTDNSSFSISGNTLHAKASFDFETKSSYSIRLRTTDNGTGNLWYEQAFTISVNNVNETPVALSLSNQNIDENAGTNAMVGSFITTDPDTGQAYTYTLVTGTGDVDNASFTISNDTLLANASFDYETKNSYSIRVRTTDNGAANLLCEGVFSVSVNNVNDAPASLTLTGQSIVENAGANVTVGTLSSTDQDSGQTHTYTLAAGTGDTDNSSFSITGTTLLANSSFDFETKSSCSIRVRVTDNGAGNLWLEEVFIITVTNINETPTAIALSTQSIAENAGVNAPVGAFSTTDSDTGQIYTYTLVAGTGAADNASFIISGNTLLVNASFDYETKNSYSIRVRTTDNGTGNLWYEEVFTISVTDINEIPHSLTLTGQSIAENAGASAVVGTLSSIDPDNGQSLTYSLVDGIGSADNSCFNISGSILQAASSFDFEIKNSYTIRIRTTDNGTGNLWCEAPFIIAVNDINDAPVDIALDNIIVREKHAGANIGNLSVSDQDNGDIHNLTVNDTRFEIVSNTLKLKNETYLTYDLEPVVPLLITATDKGSLSLTKNFSVTVQKDTTSIGPNSQNSFLATPNPLIGTFGKIVIFTFSTKGIVTAKLKIFDAVGNEVYNSPTIPGAAGKVSWDLTNRQGRIVGSGVYVAILQVTGTDGSKKILRTNLGVKEIGR